MIIEIAKGQYVDLERKIVISDNGSDTTTIKFIKDGAADTDVTVSRQLAKEVAKKLGLK